MDVRKKFFTQRVLGIGTGSTEECSQHQAHRVPETSGQGSQAYGVILGDVLFRTRSWTLMILWVSSYSGYSIFL